MTRKSIDTLIVLGSTLTALAVVRSGNRSGLKCVIMDDRPGPAVRTRHATFRRVEPDADAALIEAVQSIAAPGQAAIIADSDRWLRFLVRSSQALRNAGVLVLHPGPETLAICLSKTRFLQWCREVPLPAPRLHDVSSSPENPQLPFPLMLRPEQTQHSVHSGLPKAVQAADAAQLSHWLERFAAVGVTASVCDSLLQRPLRQFSIGAARNSDGRTLLFVAEKVRPPAERCGGGTYVCPAPAPEVEQLAEQALRQLDFYGIAEIEVLHDTATGESFLIEVNARPWLQYSLPAACGCDLLGHLLPGAIRSRQRPRRPRFRSWLYFWPDLRVCFSPDDGLVTTGQLLLGDYVRSLVARPVYAVWDCRDPVPFVSTVAAALSKRISGPSRARR